MGILDRFRPAWKNSDADVRRAAVAALGADQLDVLAEVLRNDDDAAVRLAALKRIDDVDLLAERAQQDSDEEVRELAAVRVDHLRMRAALGADERDARAAVAALSLAKSLAEVARKAETKAARQAALGRISEQPLLLEVAQGAGDPEIRAAALGRITEPQLLKHLAMHDGPRELQLKAVARLDDREALEVVAARAPVKAVRAAAAEKARAKQAVARGQEKQRDAKEAERQRLLRQLAGLEARRKQTAGGGPSGSEGLTITGAALELQAAASDPKSAAAQAADRRRLEEEQRRAAEAEAQRAQQAAAAQAEQEARRAEQEARRAEQEARRAAEQAAREAEAQRRRDEQAAREAARAEEERRYVEAAGAAVARLEPLRESDDRKALDEALQAARAVPALRGRAGAAVEEARKRLEEARATVSARLNDLRDAEGWRRWSNVPKFEALIAGAEALLANAEHGPKELAQQLKTLQAEWKALGGAPREKADLLWGRFKELGDKVHERALHGFAVLDSERVANLEKKRELIARAEAAADSTDWRATADLFKQLQEDWKAIGPVPKDDADAVWQQFRAPCDRFFAARKVVLGELETERVANLARLVALCERAELLKSSSDWKGTADAVKALQAEWKSIGPAGKTRAEADEVWQRFRAACDAFFERRKAAFVVEDEKRAANLVKKQAILARAEALADGDEVADPDTVIRGLMLEWKQVGQVPREQSDELWSRFRTACDKIRAPAPVDPDAAAIITAAGSFSNRPLEALSKKLGG
jgi:hypothetical protein